MKPQQLHLKIFESIVLLLQPNEPQLSCSPEQETNIYNFCRRLCKLCLNFRLRQAQFASNLLEHSIEQDTFCGSSTLNISKKPNA